MRRFMRLLLVFSVVLSAGCAMIPPEPIVTGPLTAEPVVHEPDPEVVARPTGSIFQLAHNSAGLTLFEDRRPRYRGDIVTVLIEEKTNASKNVQTTTDRDGSAAIGSTGMPDWIPREVADELNLTASGSNSSAGRGASRADNQFKGTITTTVIDVLPNGNLRIAGDKQIAINRGSEHVRFSGTVNPRFITGNNTIKSTQVADVRIEFRSRGVMDEVQTMGWLQRFFLNVSPF